MPAHTLEYKRDKALEMVEIGANLLRKGDDIAPPEARLNFIAECLAEATELQKKIEKRDAREAKKAVSV